jgi:hypothetical protein
MSENIMKFEIIRTAENLVVDIVINNTVYTVSFDTVEDAMAMLMGVHNYLHGLVGYKDNSKSVN